MSDFFKEVLSEPVAWILCYVLMVINTFGHAWAYISKNPLANDGGILIGSFMSALFWPLYWSVKFWS